MQCCERERRLSLYIRVAVAKGDEGVFCVASYLCVSDHLVALCCVHLCIADEAESHYNSTTSVKARPNLLRCKILLPTIHHSVLASTLSS